MAATEKKSRPAGSGTCLRVLTTAAVSLPGVSIGAGAAPGDEVHFQAGHYEESDREMHGVESDFDPIEVDFLSFGGSLGFTDDWRLRWDYHQDTWSGATPIATAPVQLFANRPTKPDGVSGATPLLNGDLLLDANLEVLETDGFGTPTGGTDNRIVHTLSSASPETRRELDLGIGYSWQSAFIELAGGFSLEKDYVSGSIGVEGRLELDERRTILSLAGRYAHGQIDARFDHDAVSYIDTSNFDGSIHNRGSGSPVLRESRDDFTLEVGLSRVLARGTVVSTSLDYTRNTGFLENPYKAVDVAFIDPDQQFLAPPGGFFANVHGLMEKRPGTRNQVGWTTSLVQSIEPLEAALHLSYRLSHDDWGLDAHTLDAAWSQPLGRSWLVTPHVRFYSQSKADFYVPYLVSPQAFETIETDAMGNIVSITPFDHALLPSNYTSDHRLSAFGALSGGVTVRKDLARNIRLEAGFDYYAHRGDWRLGGSGEASFADFEYFMVDLSLTIDLDARSLAASVAELKTRASVSEPSSSHEGHRVPAPAGVVFAHMLDDAGDFMLGYRFMYQRTHGDLTGGSGRRSDAFLVANACGPEACGSAPRSMDMHMQMLELMFAPTRWLNLMVMPSYVDMDMSLRRLDGGVDDVHSGHNDHSSGALGDTTLAAILRVADTEHQGVHVGLGISAPSGDVGVRFRRSHQEERGFLHYGMQIGSGTWDFLPSLTYTGQMGRYAWGAQVAGVVRLEDENRSGYALGDIVRSTAWGGYALTPWLSASVRLAFELEDEISGEFDGRHSTTTAPDRPENYGGRFLDAGLGLTGSITGGVLRGQSVAVEWLQPLVTDFNGYQLERTGSLLVRWRIPF